jgi:hypothetical protein
LSQSANPALHIAIAQADPEQAAVAFARVHTVPQVLQFLASLVVLTSQPFDATLSQSA